MKNRKAYLFIVARLLLVLWAYLVISKLYTHEEFEGVLTVSLWIDRSYAPFLSWALPGCFLLFFLLVLIPEARPFGFTLSALALLFFTIYIGYMLATVPEENLPCNCGGISIMLSWKRQFWVMTTLTLLAGIAGGIRIKSLVRSKSRHPPAG